MTHRTEIYGYRHLNETSIRIVAGRYDLNANESMVRANAAQADDYGTDLQSAADLLDGYLCEETRAARCDALKARDFERDAYGG